MNQIIGIDLGTTNSVAAIIEQGNPIVIPSPEGGTRIPSVVAFLPNGDIAVGEIARRQCATNPQNTVVGIKRLMGRFYDEVMELGLRFPFKLGNKNGMVAVDINGHLYLPEEISCHILRKLKTAASDYLGEEVDRAVVTVPAYFDDIQREATIHAAEMAGLKVLRLINEPTAAALAYGLGKNIEEVLAIYDFGGGTFDMSLLRVTEKMFEVLCSHGDTRLGGDDIDYLLSELVLDEFRFKHDFDISENSAALYRVREAVEQAKCNLSAAQQTVISLPFLAYKENDPLHYERTLSRRELENLIHHLVHRSLECTERALMEGNMSPDQINKVILVGGTTRIPLVQDAVADFFDIDPYKGVNPDEVVALGAATQAGIMSGELDEVTLLDVTPHSLGVEIRGGRMSKIVEKNSTIPIKAAKTFTTTQDDQDFVAIHVLQGESDNAADNISLGRFHLSDIPPSRRGSPRIRVTFFLNADGVLEVSAEELSSNKRQSLTVVHSHLSDEEHRNRRKRRSGRPAASPGSRKSPQPSPQSAAETHHPERSQPSAASSKPEGAITNGMSRQEFEMIMDESNIESQGITGGGAPSPERRSKSARLSNPANMRSPDQETTSALLGEPIPKENATGTPASAPISEPVAKVEPTKQAPGQKEDSSATAAFKSDPSGLSDTGIRTRASLMASQNVRDTQAINLYQRVIPQMLRELDKDPTRIEFYKSLLRMYSLVQDTAKAMDLIKAALANPQISEDSKTELVESLFENMSGNFEAQRLYGKRLVDTRQYDKAIEVLEKLSTEHTSDMEIIEMLENSYTASLQDQDNTAHRFKLVKVYLKRDKLDNAIEMLNELVKNPAYEKKSLKILGLCYWQKNLHYLAWQKFKALPLNAELKDILMRLSDDMESTGQYTNALQVYDWLAQEFPDDRDIQAKHKHVEKILARERERLESNATEHGSTFSRFKILEEINRGSMGIIFKAYDNTLEEVVALKLLAEYLCSDPKAVERFKREARAAKKLSHPFIVRIHDMFEADSKYAISMEFIEGTDLKKLLSKEKKIAPETILGYLTKVCDALKYAHNLGIIHRDIKPANIMITKDAIKITDFGIAKILVGKDLTHSGTAIIGTPLYMAPEQIIGGKIDVRTDIYSTGIMIYELVQGRPPFYLGNVEYHHIHTPPPPLADDVPPWLAKLIMKCIKKKPSERFQNVEEILEYLKSDCNMTLT